MFVANGGKQAALSERDFDREMFRVRKLIETEAVRSHVHTSFGLAVWPVLVAAGVHSGLTTARPVISPNPPQPHRNRSCPRT